PYPPRPIRESALSARHTSRAAIATMAVSVSDLDLRVLRREADVAARRLIRRLGLSNYEHEDLRQEFLVDLIARFKWFNPVRGTLGAFAGAIVRNRARQLANCITRERSTFVSTPFDAVSGTDNSETSTETGRVDEHYAIGHGRSFDRFATIEQ